MIAIDTTILIAGGAGLTVAMLLLGTARVVGASPPGVRGRLAALRESAEPFAADVQVLRDRRASNLGLFDALLQRREWTEQTRLTLERAGMPLRVGEYLLLRLVVGLVATVGVIAFALPALASGPGAMLVAAAFAGGSFVPVVYVHRQVGRRSRRIESQLVEMCELMASMLSSGFGYMQALSSTAEQLDPPLADELRRMIDAVGLGGDIDDALSETNDRLGSADFDIITTAITIQRKSGGNLSEILRGVARTIRARQALELEIRTLTAKERYAAVIISGVPLVIAGLLTLMLPETFARLFTDPSGRMILAAALTLDAIAFLVIRRLTRIEY